MALAQGLWGGFSPEVGWAASSEGSTGARGSFEVAHMAVSRRPGFLSLAGVLGFVPHGPLLTRRQPASPRTGFQERQTPLCPLCPCLRNDTPSLLPCSTGHANNRRDCTGCEHQQVGLTGPPRRLATTIRNERRSGHPRSLLPINITWRLSTVVKKENEIRGKRIRTKKQNCGYSQWTRLCAQKTS